MTFLYLDSDRMGRGDDDLGRRLLEAFLAELAASDIDVDVVGCVNSAVLLTTEAGPAFESIRALAEKGARVASCGTSLDHYERREMLLVGEVGNMADTVSVMVAADRVIRV